MTKLQDSVPTGNISQLIKKIKSGLHARNVPMISSDDFKGFFENHHHTGLPVIFRTKPILNDFIELKSVLNRTPITVRQGNYSDPQEYAFSRKTTNVDAAKFIDEIENSNTSDYAGNIEITWETFDQLSSKVNFFQKDDFENPRVWLGPKNCITPLHIDGPDNFTIHLLGTKRWVLFPLGDYPRLKMFVPRPVDFPDLHVSRIDLSKYQAIEEINSELGTNAIELLLEPGQTLYVPSGWGHFVETKTNSLMVNLWLNPARHLAGLLKT